MYGETAAVASVAMYVCSPAKRPKPAPGDFSLLHGNCLYAASLDGCYQQNTGDKREFAHWTVVMTGLTQLLLTDTHCPKTRH